MHGTLLVTSMAALVGSVLLLSIATTKRKCASLLLLMSLLYGSIVLPAPLRTGMTLLKSLSDLDHAESIQTACGHSDWIDWNELSTRSHRFASSGAPFAIHLTDRVCFVPEKLAKDCAFAIQARKGSTLAVEHLFGIEVLCVSPTEYLFVSDPLSFFPDGVRWESITAAGGMFAGAVSIAACSLIVRPVVDRVIK